MNDRYLFKAKRIDNEEWVQGHYVNCLFPSSDVRTGHFIVVYPGEYYEIYTPTLCQCTGLKDKAGNLIWENDILMCHNSPQELVKAVFGEFSVFDDDSLSVIDRVVGWHYEVIPTDEISKCEPFCLSMPLTDFYIDMCDMKVCGSK